MRLYILLVLHFLFWFGISKPCHKRSFHSPWGLHSSARALACLASHRTPHHTTANISLTDQLHSLWRKLLVSFLTTVEMSIILITPPSLELFVFATPMPYTDGPLLRPPSGCQAIEEEGTALKWTT